MLILIFFILISVCISQEYKCSADTGKDTCISHSSLCDVVKDCHSDELNCNCKFMISKEELKCNGGVMVSMLALSVVDRGFESWSGKTKDYQTNVCIFSAKQAVLINKSKDWLAWKQDNVSVWRDYCFSVS